MRKFYSMKNLAIALVVALAMPATVQAENESNVVFYESFNGLTGHGGNDGYFDNDEAANVEVGAEDLTSADLLDNKTGWGSLSRWQSATSVCASLPRRTMVNSLLLPLQWMEPPHSHLMPQRNWRM